MIRENVVGLHVPMHDTKRMQVFKPFQDLSSEKLDDVLFELQRVVRIVRRSRQKPTRRYRLTLPCVRTIRPIDPPGTYSKKMDKCSRVSSMPADEKSATVPSPYNSSRLTKVKYDVWMIEILE